MNINIMRKIDKYLGPIICRFLLFTSVINKLLILHNKNSPIPSKKYNKILIIKFFGIGSILLSSPSFRALKEKYPYAEITILTISSNREICEMLPSIDRVICLEIDNFLPFIVNFIKTLSYIRKINFDIIIDLEFITNFSSMTTLLITIFTKHKETVGFLSPIKWRNSVYNINVSFDHSRHITKIFSKVVKSLCGNDFKLSFLPETVALAKYANVKFLEKLLEMNEDLRRCKYFICVNINTGMLSLHRRWPKKYFSIVIKELVKKPDIAIFLIGGREDVAYVSDFQEELPRSPQIINLCGKTSIMQLIGLFSKSNLLITNDSGPLHLAQIMGLSTISFFGPETPYLYGPIGENHSVFYEDLFCSPCLNIYNSKLSHCKDNICMQAIKPERVLALITKKYLSPRSKVSLHNEKSYR